jgi:hypothetical protein
MKAFGMRGLKILSPILKEEGSNGLALGLNLKKVGLII